MFVVDLSGTVFTLVAAFLLGCAVASLEADVGLGSGFSELAVFHVSVSSNRSALAHIIKKDRFKMAAGARAFD